MSPGDHIIATLLQQIDPVRRAVIEDVLRAYDPGLDCHECLGRGFVKQPRRLVGWSFDPCPRCDGSGKEGLRG